MMKNVQSEVTAYPLAHHSTRTGYNYEKLRAHKRKLAEKLEKLVLRCQKEMPSDVCEMYAVCRVCTSVYAYVGVCREQSRQLWPTKLAGLRLRGLYWQFWRCGKYLAVKIAQIKLTTMADALHVCVFVCVCEPYDILVISHIMQTGFFHMKSKCLIVCVCESVCGVAFASCLSHAQRVTSVSIIQDSSSSRPEQGQGRNEHESINSGASKTRRDIASSMATTPTPFQLPPLLNCARN